MAGKRIPRTLLPIEIILSCNVCCKPISEVYREADSDKGFSDGTAGRDVERQVTKLWLTECTHLTCGEHLEGGGVPFHPAGQQPKARCPYCVANKNKHDKVTLYGIRGCNDDQYDPAIPKNFFNTPPITLDGREAGLDALRFQYLSLVHFGTSIFSRCQQMEDELSKLRSTRATETEEIVRLRKSTQRLEATEAQLERCEKELRPWKQRESKIKYYLGVFTQVMEENTRLKKQLGSLGYAVPDRALPPEPPANGTFADPLKEPLQEHTPLDHEQTPVQRPTRVNAQQASQLIHVQSPPRSLHQSLQNGEYSMPDDRPNLREASRKRMASRVNPENQRPSKVSRYTRDTSGADRSMSGNLFPSEDWRAREAAIFPHELSTEHFETLGGDQPEAGRRHLDPDVKIYDDRRWQNVEHQTSEWDSQGQKAEAMQSHRAHRTYIQNPSGQHSLPYPHSERPGDIQGRLGTNEERFVEPEDVSLPRKHVPSRYYYGLNTPSPPKRRTYNDAIFSDSVASPFFGPRQSGQRSNLSTLASHYRPQASGNTQNSGQKHDMAPPGGFRGETRRFGNENHHTRVSNPIIPFINRSGLTATQHVATSSSAIRDEHGYFQRPDGYEAPAFGSPSARRPQPQFATEPFTPQVHQSHRRAEMPIRSTPSVSSNINSLLDSAKYRFDSRVTNPGYARPAGHSGASSPSREWARSARPGVIPSLTTPRLGVNSVLSPTRRTVRRR
ncbi:MAG: hypothetical protein M1828_007182 [Chrysothrix sp. TS-e1954]|nr:MAG: hypothetical protein M1828_007182 [Chrysothrix sp. TS-e1954]